LTDEAQRVEGAVPAARRRILVEADRSCEDKVPRMKLFFLPFLVLLAGVPARSLGQAAADTKPANSPPWKINKSIVSVEKTLHRKRPAGGGAVDYSVSYIGPKLERIIYEPRK
jgi:hypothetical protein